MLPLNFENSKVVIIPLPEILLLYFKKYNYEQYFTDNDYEYDMRIFIYNIIELARQHMWQIDRDINAEDISNLVNTTSICSNLYKDNDEYINLLSVINKSAKELISFIGNYNYSGNRYAILKFDEISIYVEVETS